jgi:hypothetical protein
MIYKAIRLLPAILAAALLSVPAAFAAGSAQEASTAAKHASFAAKSPTIQQVHMHLHHAVNCLVGPDGAGFDTSQANPCAGQGNGAIPDATDPVMKQRLKDAVAVAKSGLATDDIEAARQAANDVQKILGNPM